MSSLGNGGAFGGKSSHPLAAIARRLADAHGRAVRVLNTREDVVRFGPKRPPIGAGIDASGGGVLHAAGTPGLASAVAAIAPDWTVVALDVGGPPTSVDLRGAGWVEAAVLLASLQAGPEFSVTAPNGAVATAAIDEPGDVRVSVRCGRPLDEVVLRSYCHGAVHMALGWVRSEGLSVDDDGDPQDLTIRSFGILRAVDMPSVSIAIEPDDGPPVNGSDAVFAAVATAAWARSGWSPRWPTEH